LIAASEEAPFKTLVQGAFSQRRKQMLRVVRTLFDLNGDQAADLLSAAGIDHSARPEVLPVEAFVRLLRAANVAQFKSTLIGHRRSTRDSKAQS
jgi:16S rRNA A1518/A1519 N6-dimethyltransferase RsmA/KsgA/DIM1 with predicted DNA glycosylase/AP lyase activity